MKKLALLFLLALGGSARANLAQVVLIEPVPDQLWTYDVTYIAHCNQDFRQVVNFRLPLPIVSEHFNPMAVGVWMVETDRQCLGSRRDTARFTLPVGDVAGYQFSFIQPPY